MTSILTHSIERAAPAVLAAAGTFATAGGALAAEAEGGGMPQLDPSTYPTQIFWLVVSFTVLFLLMWKVALPRVGEVIEQREQKISADLERAEKLREEVEQVTAEYEKLLADARGDAQEQFRKAQDKVKADQDKKLAKSEDEIAARIAEAEERIEEARKAALGELRSVAEDAAGAAVAKLTGETPDPAAIKKAVEAAAKEA